jgi:aminoglycoside phosphotransferase (APT) family kinase protein
VCTLLIVLQATIGHPLSDVTNLIMPFTTANNPLAARAGRMNTAFIEGRTPGLPTKQQCVKWYEEVVGWKVDPRELVWAEAFGIYRGAIIMQGIAARYAQRQASSEKAMDYGNMMKPHSEMAWEFVQEVKKQSMSEQEKAAGRGYMAKL